MTEETINDKESVIIEEDDDKEVDNDGDLVFDAVNDMWVTVRVDKNDIIEAEVDDEQYWVWEVGDTEDTEEDDDECQKSG